MRLSSSTSRPAPRPRPSRTRRPIRTYSARASSRKPRRTTRSSRSLRQCRPAPASTSSTRPSGLFDNAYLGCLPTMVIMAASDEAELVHMVATQVAINDRPSSLRYPRGEGRGIEMPDVGIPLEIGKGRVVREGSKIALLSFGTRLAECEKAADELAADGLSTTVADARFMKPLDVDLVLRLAREHEVLITVEEAAIGG